MAGFFAFCSLAISLGLLIYGMRQFRKFRIVAGKNPMRIGSIRGGFFEFRGKVKPLAVIHSPFSRTECVFYRFHEEEWVSGSSQSPGEWRTTRSEENAVEFLLDDGSGVARILPEGADWHLHVDIDRARTTDPSAGGIRISFGKSVATDKRRTTESYVVAGDTIHVIGTARPASGGAARITLSGEGAPIFLITDQPKGELVGHLQLVAFASWIGSVLLFVIPLFGFLVSRATRLPP